MARGKAQGVRKSTASGIRLPDAELEARLAARMKVSFRDPYLLRLALTHRSVLHDWLMLESVDARLQSNERLEFLGDAVLGSVVAEYLYRQNDLADEGTLTRERAAIVRSETLVSWSRELDLPACMYLGIGEKVTDSARDRILAGAFEALVGAIFIDQGRLAAAGFIHQFLDRYADAIREAEVEANPKGRLQELVQERAMPTPEYATVAAEGPDHARVFTEVVLIDGRELGRGSGRSKRLAQQTAARLAIATLEAEFANPEPPVADA
jgi:ribonuclease-3